MSQSDEIAAPLTRGERETLESYLVALWQCETERGYREFVDRVLAHVAQIKAAGALIAEDDARCELAAAGERVRVVERERDASDAAVVYWAVRAQSAETALRMRGENDACPHGVEWARFCGDCMTAPTPPLKEPIETYTIDQIREAYAKRAGLETWDAASLYEDGLIAALRGKGEE